MEPLGPAGHAAVRFSPVGFARAPVSYLLSYAGVLRQPPRHASADVEVGGGSVGGRGGEVSIRIVGGGEREEPAAAGEGPPRQHLAVGYRRQRSNGMGIEQMEQIPLASNERVGGDGVIGGAGEGGSSSSSSVSPSGGVGGEAEMGGEATGGSDNSYQRYDVQQAAKWIEHALPFSLLLMLVFIRQHLQGFFTTILIAAVMFKSNEILRKQTALKGERKISVLVGFALVSTVHVVGFYWWYRNDLFYLLIMLPPKEIPPFWQAVFFIMLNDTMVRQAAMVFKCMILLYYKNSRGRNYRRQGQMLTLVEYLILLYRALLPTTVWYRFFLNKEYGSLFSSLTTGLYLTFKFTSVVEKVQSFIAACKALSRTGINYGSYATLEQVIAAGDLCAICQEKLHAPVLLRCKHIFCEDCVSEWFERERTCPLCRALVKPPDLRSFGDGSTSLFFQLF